MRLEDITLDTPMPKCRRPHPRSDRRDPAYKGCPDCRARNRWVKLVAQDERRRGVYRTLVDVELVQAQVRLLVESGHTRKSIAADSGVSHETISTFMRAGVKKVQPITYDAIMSVEPIKDPHGTRKRYKGEAAGSPAGTIRIIQGLHAQGWTLSHMGEVLSVQKSYISAILRRPDRLIITSTVEKFRVLADKLGPYDLTDLTKPMPGMSIKAVRYAEKMGWVPLRDWDDIDDPDAEPHRPDPLEASNGIVLVDPDKIRLALTFTVREAAAAERRYSVHADRFTVPLTRFEFYETVRAGSERDYAGVVRYSANLLSQRLGVAERTIQRCRADLARADWLLDAAPTMAGAILAAERILGRSKWPATLRLHAVAEILASYPLEIGFYRHLVVLGATQPRPYGRGWSDAELAAWIGCDVIEATALRARAVLAGRRYQETRPCVTGRRPSAGLTAAA